jgi:hypothetical protein
MGLTRGVSQDRRVHRRRWNIRLRPCLCTRLNHSLARESFILSQSTYGRQEIAHDRRHFNRTTVGTCKLTFFTPLSKINCLLFHEGAHLRNRRVVHFVPGLQQVPPSIELLLLHNYAGQPTVLTQLLVLLRFLDRLAATCNSDPISFSRNCARCARVLIKLPRTFFWRAAFCRWTSSMNRGSRRQRCNWSALQSQVAIISLGLFPAASSPAALIWFTVSGLALYPPGVNSSDFTRFILLAILTFISLTYTGGGRPAHGQLSRAPQSPTAW